MVCYSWNWFSRKTLGLRCFIKVVSLLSGHCFNSNLLLIFQAYSSRTFKMQILPESQGNMLKNPSQSAIFKISTNFSVLYLMSNLGNICFAEQRVPDWKAAYKNTRHSPKSQKGKRQKHSCPSGSLSLTQGSGVCRRIRKRFPHSQGVYLEITGLVITQITAFCLLVTSSCSYVFGCRNNVKLKMISFFHLLALLKVRRGGACVETKTLER